MKLGVVANQLLLSANKCEKCGYSLRHKDDTGLRKWCCRCIAVYKRKESLTPAKIDKVIIETVEPLYFNATLDGLDADVRAKLLNLQNGQDVFMFGPVGTGKTYAMAALIRHYVSEGYECRRVNFDDFCIEIRSTYSQASKITERQLVEAYRNFDKLFIDDLGLRTKLESDFAYHTLYSLINKRQERLLPTYICSNKSIEQLGQSFDARIASRLRAAVVIEMTGEDRRNGVFNKTPSQK